MTQTELQIYLKSIADQTKDEFVMLYRNLFLDFEKNYLDYRAYIFYGSYFVFDDEKYFDIDVAMMVFNSIIDYEDWIAIMKEIPLSEPIIVDKTINGVRSFSVSYKNPSKRIILSDNYEAEAYQKRNNLIDKICDDSIKINTANFEKIPKKLLVSPTYTRKLSSRFDYLIKEDLENWYQVFIFLLKVHFDNLVVDNKKEICIRKDFTNQISLIIKIDKKVFLRELKMGSIKLNLINSRNVSIITNKTEFPIAIVIPYMSFSFPITENMDRNHYFLNKLDVYLASYAYSLIQYFNILEKKFNNDYLI
jgi:hypothetical protein